MLSLRLRTLLPTAMLLACSSTTDPPITPPITTPQTPPPSAGHELVYHDGVGAVLLVNAGLGGGGNVQSSQRTKLWAWRGGRWEVIDSAGPPIRNLGGVAYDRRRNVLVLYGGTFSQSLSYSDTWEWTPAGWRQNTAQGPGVRDHVQMVYDETLGKILLASGQGSGETFPADVWTFDGTQWTRVADGTGLRRIHHTLVYHGVRQRTLLIGGTEPGVGAKSETFQFENGAWRSDPALAITPRSHARSTFIESNGSVMVVGGFAGFSARDDVLISNAQGWQSYTGNRPSARYLTALAYDRQRRVVVLFGGGNDQGLLADTWEWDGTRWTQR